MLTGKNVKVNYLGSTEVSYSIDEVPGERIVKRYINGSSLCKVLFIFASREGYSEAAIQNMKVSGFYEKFSEWLETGLPTLPTGYKAQSIKAITNGYAQQTDAQTKQMRYQIQCELKFIKE